MNYLLNASAEALGQYSYCEFEGGFLVEEEHLQCALEVLNSEIAGQSATNWEGVIALTLRRKAGASAAAASQPVSIGCWEAYHDYDSQRDIFTGIAREVLSPIIGRPIVIMRVCKGERVPPPLDGKFYLYMGYGIRSNSDSLRKIFGIDLGGMATQIVAKNGEFAATISDVDTGFPIVQIEKHAAWILSTCFYNGGKSFEAPLFRRFCEEIAFELVATPELRVERIEREARERRERSRAAYVQECSRRFEKTLSGTREAIERGHADVRKLQEQLVRRIRETQGAERKLEQLENARPQATSGYGVEFDKLVTVPKVRDVQVTDGVVKVFTEILYCVDPRTTKRHEIGAFRIEIYTSNGNVRWFNLTRKVDTYWTGANAPHVNGSGDACLGTMAEIIPDLVANYEFAALVMVAIQFVESVNTDDSAGKHIDKWPVAE